MRRIPPWISQALMRCARRPLTSITIACITVIGVPRAAAEDQAATTPPASQKLTIVAGELDQARSQIAPSLGATTYQIGLGQIDAEAQGDNASFNQTLLRAPGVAQDSFGQVHVRGEHANLQYRINDVLLPEGITGFGQELDTHFAADITFITGSLPAQYGFRTAGVVDIHTKAGDLAPGVTLSAYGGSYDTVHLTAETGGTIGNVTAYSAISYQHSALGLENPTPSQNAIHDDSDQLKGFAYASFVLDPTSRISIILSASLGQFQIPDNPNQMPAYNLSGASAPSSSDLDERQSERNSYAVVAYQKSMPFLDYQVAGYVRGSGIHFTPDEDGDLIYNGVASTADLSTVSVGTQFDASLSLGSAHTLRGGVSLLAQYAVSDTSTLVFPTAADGSQTSTVPLDIMDNQTKWGQFDGIYLQDEWRVMPAWTVNYGARFDEAEAYVKESQLSPRLNTTIDVTKSTTLHVGYARYFTPPPLESVQQTTVSKFDGTSNAAATEQDDPVRSERANYFDAGATQHVGKNLQFGVDGYYKRAQHQLDDGQFGTAVIFTPFNYREGTVDGVELTSAYQEEAFSVYGNLAFSRAIGTDIESAQFDFTPAELAYIQNHTVYLDHDQRCTASGGVAYRPLSRMRVFSDMLYGSGLRKGFANTEQIPSYFTLNAGMEYTWSSLTARVDVVNVLDRVYEIRDGSGIGVGAPQYGQRRGYYGGLSYSF